MKKEERSEILKKPRLGVFLRDIWAYEFDPETHFVFAYFVFKWMGNGYRAFECSRDEALRQTKASRRAFARIMQDLAPIFPKEQSSTKTALYTFDIDFFCEHIADYVNTETEAGKEIQTYYKALREESKTAKHRKAAETTFAEQAKAARAEEQAQINEAYKVLDNVYKARVKMYNDSQKNEEKTPTQIVRSIKNTQHLKHALSVYDIETIKCAFIVWCDRVLDGESEATDILAAFLYKRGGAFTVIATNLRTFQNSYSRRE